jgi:hypothetical protein
VVRESAAFEQFQQPKSLGPVSLLYPVAPLVMLIGTWIVGSLVAVILAAACFIPGLIISRNRMRAFERSGTDRTDRALAISTQAFGTALGGLLYIAVAATFVAISIMR